MSSMNVSLPADMKAYVDERVSTSSYQTSSEYVRDLIRRDQEITHFRALIAEGMASPVEREVDAAWFAVVKDDLRR